MTCPAAEGRPAPGGHRETKAHPGSAAHPGPQRGSTAPQSSEGHQETKAHPGSAASWTSAASQDHRETKAHVGSVAHLGSRVEIEAHLGFVADQNFVGKQEHPGPGAGSVALLDSKIAQGSEELLGTRVSEVPGTRLASVATQELLEARQESLASRGSVDNQDLPEPDINIPLDSKVNQAAMARLDLRGHQDPSPASEDPQEPKVTQGPVANQKTKVNQSPAAPLEAKVNEDPVVCLDLRVHRAPAATRAPEDPRAPLEHPDSQAGQALTDWNVHQAPVAAHSPADPQETEVKPRGPRGPPSGEWGRRRAHLTAEEQQTQWRQFSNMNVVADFLCLLACLTVVTCDRVYVHPFNLFSFNESDCDKLEKMVQEGKTIVPVSIESQTTPEYEDGMNDNKLEAANLSTWGKEERSYLSDLVVVLGMRFYSALQKAQRGQNVLLSPTSLYSSLLSFYLGASNQTALDLKGLLGFDPPSGNPDCISTAVGSNFLSSLRTIERLVKSGDQELLFCKTLSLFSAPGIALFQLFMEHLLPSADAFYARAVDFANPGKAAKQINAFVEAKSEGRSKGFLADMDPSTELLFVVDVRLAVNVKQAFPLKEPQEFWVDSNTKVLVPMLSIMGTFKYKTDASGTFSVVEVPLSQTALLVLLQPSNGSDLERLESQPLWQSSAWLQRLSPREIKLTLPTLTLEDSCDLQELLADMELPALLGKGADFSKISNASLTVGKVINKAFFKLASDGTDQPEDPAAQKEDGVYLDVTLNKPFLFAVFEKQSRAMLFLGRVVNPLHED